MTELELGLELELKTGSDNELVVESVPNTMSLGIGCIESSPAVVVVVSVGIGLGVMISGYMFVWSFCLSV